MVCAGRVERQRLRLSEMTALTELPLVFEDWIDLAWTAELTFRERLFTPSHTFWLFLSQVFSADGSCDEAVRQALAHVALAGRGSLLPSANTWAYCQARKRLPGTVTAQILEQLTEKIERQPERLWYGHPVKVVDGSTCSMPDTPANQQFFGQPSGQKAGCGFPVMRLAAMFSLSSGALIGRACGPFSTGERTLWRELWTS